MDIKKLSLEIAENMERVAGVKAVFGEPVKEGEVTIVPVGRVKVRGGGGVRNKTGSNHHENKETGFGLGFGLSMKSAPIGYIEIKDNTARFVHIFDKTGIIMAGIAFFALSIWVLGRGPRPRVFI